LYTCHILTSAPAPSFEPSQDARSRAAAEGNTRPEDMIPVYRKRTTIDPSGRETEQKQTYYVVDSVEALSKFGPDAWDRVVCVMTTGQAWQFRPYKWNEPRTLFHHGASFPVARTTASLTMMNRWHSERRVRLLDK
jgi:parafibromin